MRCSTRLFLGALVLAGRGRDAAAFARLVPDAIGLFARLLRDPGVPRRTKLLLAFALAYLAMPLDLVPDFISVVGALDDALIVMLVLRAVLSASGPGSCEQPLAKPSPRLCAWCSRSSGGAPRAARHTRACSPRSGEAGALLATLRAYADLTSCARPERLIVHPNTVHHRLLGSTS